ncbi:MAG: ABC transporter permease [Betaproteobacteria bacterium]
MVDDLRFGVRLLRKNLLLSAATVLTLTIGIGLNAGVFTILDGLLFRPRVAHDPASFIELTLDRTDADGRTPALPLFSLQDYAGFARASSLADVAAWSPVHATVGEEGEGGAYVALLVSCNFFETYGPERPLLGRRLRAEDCAGADSSPVAVIGEDLWRTAMASTPAVIGSTLVLNRRAFTIVGVMPSAYAGQLRGPIWIPFTASPTFFDGRDLERERATPWLLGVVARLRPGVGRATAAAEVAVIARQLDAATPHRRTTVRLTGGAMIDEPLVRQAAGWAVLLVMAAPALVLLIACANVALLLLSRAMARRREMAVRASLGASRSRLLRMLIVESALLAAVAAPPSAAAAACAPRVFRALIPSMPYYPFAVDARVILFLAAIALVAGVAAGVAPALEALREDVSGALRGHDSLPGVSGWRPRDVLVAAQVGLSLVLLVGAGLFLHAETRLLSANPGYDVDRVLLVAPRFSVPPHTPESAAALFETFLRRSLGVPGVRAVSYARGAGDESAAPPASTLVTADRSGVAATAAISVVSSAYFGTLRIPFVGGGPFGDDPASDRSVVISESLARTLWPGRMPIGQTARLGDGEVSVAGVVRDVVSIVSGAGERTVYRPAGAVRAGDAAYVGFEGAERDTARAVRDAITALDPDATARPLTLAATRREEARRFMPLVEMVVGLGIVGLALGVAGIYGVVSFATGRRMREMGIRIALGATRGDVVRTVIASSVPPVAVGIIAGLALATVGARTLARLFVRSPVHMEAWDPLVYASVILTLSAAALAAMLAPAARAAGTDPVHALRQE